MAVDGRTHSPDYRNVVQLYEFDKIRAWTRRGITPTDIDGRYLIHSRKKNSHLWFEFKTEGGEMSPFQLEALDGVLEKGAGRDCLIIAEHPRLRAASIPPDATRYRLRMRDASVGEIRQTRWFTTGTDGHLGWWVRQWFSHAEDARPGHFVTAFRQSAGIYKVAGVPTWARELTEAGNGN